MRYSCSSLPIRGHKFEGISDNAHHLILGNCIGILHPVIKSLFQLEDRLWNFLKKDGDRQVVHWFGTGSGSFDLSCALDEETKNTLEFVVLDNDRESKELFFSSFGAEVCLAEETLPDTTIEKLVIASMFPR